MPECPASGAKVGTQVRRYGYVALPIVLMALGLWILSGARVLIR